MFEGGSPAESQLQNPFVKYDITGSFDVRLAASNAAGGDTLVREDYITVLPAPVILLSSNKPDNAVCKEDPLMLYASGADEYFWYNDRGFLVGVEDSLEVYPRLNTFYFVLGRDRYGGEGTEFIDVYSYPLPEVDLGRDTALSENESIVLDAGGGFPGYTRHLALTCRGLYPRAGRGGYVL